MAWTVEIRDVAGVLYEGSVEGANLDEALMAASVEAQIDGFDEGSFQITVTGAA